MTTLQINESKVLEQEEKLASYLSARFPDVDLSPGSVLRTTALRISVYAYAILDAMLEQKIKPRLSLLNLEQAEDSEEIDIIVDQLLANWFISRKDGDYARGTAIIHASRQTDITIPSTAFFYKNGLQFILHGADTTTIAATNLNPVQDENGNIIEYTGRIPLICNTPGADGEIEAGSFETWTQFNPYITRVEAEAKFFNGIDVETSAELIQRARTAISERSLVTKRSIDATLRNQFTSVPSTVIIGASDLEMMRDLIELPSGESIHVLGHVNIYVPFPLLPSQTLELIVASAYADPGDPSSIPLSESHTVVLPAIPFMRITEVKDLDDDQVFSRSNTTPDIEGEYQVVDQRPADAFSSRQYRKLILYNNGNNDRDNHTLKITYDTVEGFSSVDLYTLSDSNRVLVANTLVFSQYPIWLEFTLKFSYLDSAIESLDTDLAKDFISSYVKIFPASETLSVSAITTQFQSAFATVVSSVTPFTITYYLECPDGRLIAFQTTDKVLMQQDHLVNTGDIEDFYALQLSDRTVRYLSAPDLIVIEEDIQE